MVMASTRSIEVAIDIEAPRQHVWAALTDENQIPRWLAPSASVKPGAGGYIELSWGEGMTGRNTIDVWNPQERLVLVNKEQGLREEYSLSEVGGGTRLSLVHSGFAVSPKVDDQYDAINNGWRTFFRMLKHAAKRGAGASYRNVTVFSPLSLTRDVAWHRIVRPSGITVGGLSPLTDGQRYETMLRTGQHLIGSVVHCAWPGYLVLAADNMDDSLFALFCERSSEGSLLTITWILNGQAVILGDSLHAQWSEWVTAAAGTFDPEAGVQATNLGLDHASVDQSV